MLKLSRCRRGFSLIEVIAAVVILAVVSTATVSALVPMRAKSQAKIEQQNIARLTGIVQAYYMETGRYPDQNMTLLQTEGFTQARLQPTPYGGNYRWDSTSQSVVNPHAPQ
jgi:prepilin-type N-terminal cleavage/methylation domain-containing protein